MWYSLTMVSTRPERLGEAIKRRREQLRMSQEDLVLAIHEMGEKVSIQNIRAIEQGKRQEPRIDTVTAISKGLGWPKEALWRVMDGEDWRKIETVEHEDQGTLVTRLAGEVDELRQRIDRIESGGAPRTSEEQAIWDSDLPEATRRRLIAFLRDENGGATAAG